MGLWYPKDSGFELTAFSDVDHAGCLDTRKSTSGGIQFLGDKLVSGCQRNRTALQCHQQKPSTWHYLQVVLKYKQRCCSLIPAESDSLPHAHAQTTKTYYKHQDLRIKKAQELKIKTSTNSDIKDPSSQTKLRGRLLESFQEDAKYEHVV
ncbi:hypothetical protein Tco_0705544 [Tanacetum coccineum]|uniref:Uncharacterized protein n=1 Tax=Tanacetum coccineum TaxID=301880 RepID=A0ABQ4Y4W6_9ASTR